MCRCLASQERRRLLAALSSSWPVKRNSYSGRQEIAVLRKEIHCDLGTTLVVLLLVLGGGGGYYGSRRWGSSGGAGVGLGTILVVLLVAYMLGAFH